MDINLVIAMKSLATTGYSHDSTFKASNKKDLGVITKRAEAAVRNLELKTEGEATVICPITGLLVPSDLPTTGNNFLVCTHPLVFNALAIVNHNEYLDKLSDAQTVGLLLALLNTLGKGSIDPTSSAFAINLRLQALFNKQELMEFIAWVFDNLGRTNAYYPPITLDHKTLHKGTFSDYTNWIASLSFEFYESKVEERVFKATTPSTEIQIKRLDSNAYDEWLDMASKLSLPKSFVEKAKPYVKKLISTPSSDLLNKICSKVEALAKDESELIENADCVEEIKAIGELFTLEILDMRAKAERLGYYKAQLDDWDAPTAVTTQVIVEKEVTEPKPVEAKKVNFLDLLKKKG